MKVRTAAALVASALTLLVASLSTAQQAPRRAPPASLLADATPATAPAGTPAATPPGSPTSPRAPQPSGADAAEPGSNLRPFEGAMGYEALPPGARVALNLQDADLPDLIRAIGNITGKRFIVPSKARSVKTTVWSPTRVTPSEAWQAFLSALRGEGMTAIQVGRFWRIEETGVGAAVPTATTAQGTPDSDRFVTRIHRLRNLSADDAAAVVSHFKSRDGDVTAHAATGTLILTDAASNVRRMIQILTEIDQPAMGEQIWVERVQYANATELGQRITETLNNGRSGGGGGGGSPAPAAPGAGPPTPSSARPVRLIPDERTNSLIVVATQRDYLRVIELMRELDRPVTGEGEAHVHPLQNADATELVESINQLVNGARQAGGGAGGPGGGGGGAARPSGVFEGPISVSANKRTNALLVTASPRDWAAVRRIINELDQERRQVFIEGVVVDMSVDNTRNVGVSWHGGDPIGAGGALLVGGLNPIGSLFNPLTGGVSTNSAATAASQAGMQNTLQGLALGVRGPVIPGLNLPGFSGGITQFGAVITALSTTGNADVLATPSIVATDNIQATFEVGADVPLQTNAPSFASAPGANPLLGLTATNPQRTKVGTIIRVLPHVNDSDRVRLEIEEEISDAGAATGTLGVVSINRNVAKTTTTVRDGQTVVIGGLIRNAVVQTRSGIPFLSDIPLLGALFRTDYRHVERRNLLLFLTPYVIRDQSDLRRIFERRMRERQEFLDRYFVFSEAGSVRPDVDYTRTNGMVEEIRQAIQQQRTQAEIEARGVRAPPPPHSVSRPIDAEAPPGPDDARAAPPASLDGPALPAGRRGGSDEDDADDDRRGVAQQPPPPPELRSAR